MNKKPIDVLNEQINVYKKFIASVESAKNLEVSEEQVEKIICEARLKITEFEDAVKILSEETRKDYKKCNHSWVELKYPVLAWKCKKCGQIKC